MAEWTVELPGTVAEGDPGKAGAPGKDGFGTESQYDAIIDRLDALEA